MQDIYVLVQKMYYFEWVLISGRQDNEKEKRDERNHRKGREAPLK